MKGLAILLVLVPAAGQAETREAAAWRWMLDVCVAYLETGHRAVFDNGPPDGELVAHPGGGVCNGDPACERHEMVFVGAGDFGMGAVRVFDSARPVVGSDPRDAVCAPALGLPFRTEQIVDAQNHWVREALSSGRLTFSPARLWGCAWNGKKFWLGLRDYGFPTFEARLEPDADACAAPPLS